MVPPVITALDYIGIASPAAREWETFGPDVLGLEFAGRGTEGEVRLRNDDAVQRLTIYPADENGVAYFGWGVGGPIGLADMIGRIQAAGFDVANGDAALVEQRGVSALAWFTDSFGFRPELAYGLLRRPSTFRPGRAMNGFVTGDGGVGHAVIVVPDLVVADDFFTRVLGFKLSDTIEIGSVSASTTATQGTTRWRCLRFREWSAATDSRRYDFGLTCNPGPMGARKGDGIERRQSEPRPTDHS